MGEGHDLIDTFIFFNVFLFYFWYRERQSMNGGGAEREGDRGFEASGLHANRSEPGEGLEVMNHEIMT